MFLIGVQRRLKMSKCKWNYKGWCYALACYSNTPCGARDEGGNLNM